MTARQRPERGAGGRMTGGDRREQIIDVAVRLFSQRGFRGTTTKEIALAAGVNEAIIFRHFATKGDLYAAIIDRKVNSPESQAMQASLEEATARGDDRQVFEALALHILEFHERDDTAMRVLLYSALEGHELAQMIFETQVSVLLRRLADYIDERVRDGVFRRVDSMTAVRAFIGMVIHHAMGNKFFRCDFFRITNGEAAARFTDIFLAGIANPDYRPDPGAGPAPKRR